MNKESLFNRTRFIPIVGILCYVALYIIAAQLYPGGSHWNVDRAGFDWSNNYWCNLLDKYAINGELNPGRPYAIIGMYVLCLSLAFFFYQFPHFFKLEYPWDIIVVWSGVLATTFALLVSTVLHDIMSIFASLFGTISIVGIFSGLRKKKMISFIWTGMICVFLLVVNAYIYFSKNYIDTLPIIQKITFVVILLWVVTLNLMFGVEKELVPIKRNLKPTKKSLTKK